MPLSMVCQRACSTGAPPASVFNTHSPLLSMVDCTSYSQVRTLRPATARFCTVTLLKLLAKSRPQPIGHTAPPVATVESPASQIVILACGGGLPTSRNDHFCAAAPV